MPSSVQDARPSASNCVLMALHPARWLSSWVRFALASLLLLTIGFAGASAATTRAITRPAIDIYPLGDSITLGVSNLYPPRGYFPGGYRGRLDQLLISEGVPHRFVGTSTMNPSEELASHGQTHHDGHGGYRIDQISTDLNGLAHLWSDNGGHWLTGVRGRAPIYPEVVIIHLGTNDIFRWYDPGVHYPTPSGYVNYSDPSQRTRFVNDMVNRLSKLVDKIVTLRPAARIVLSSIVPMELHNFLPVTDEYAGGVAWLAARERHRHRHVVYADVYHHFVKDVRGRPVPIQGLVSPPGIHPTPAGYSVMASVYLQAINQALRT